MFLSLRLRLSLFFQNPGYNIGHAYGIFYFSPFLAAEAYVRKEFSSEGGSLRLFLHAPCSMPHAFPIIAIRIQSLNFQMIKQTVSSVLRKLHLAHFADLIRYKLMSLKNHSQNTEFKKQHPTVILPPDYLMYESFQINYSKYYTGGREDAREIIDLARPYVNFNASRILDWGCGPARLIRHLPSILGKQNEYFGTDYNATTIEWCTNNIPGITFSKNEVNPPLHFPDDHFTFIYGISILTHLSPENQHAWSRELNRIVKPEGIVLLTTHGEAFIEKLTKEETESYTKGQIVARGNVTEGHRMYGTFHPPAFMNKVFEDSGFKIELFIPGKRVNQSFISQDTWLLRKVLP